MSLISVENNSNIILEAKYMYWVGNLSHSGSLKNSKGNLAVAEWKQASWLPWFIEQTWM